MTAFAPEALLMQVLRDDSSLLCELFAKLSGRRLSSQLQPLEVREYLDPRDDSPPALAYRNGSSWIVCEVLNRVSKEKRRQWSRTAVGLHEKTGAWGEIAVITASAAVVRQAGAHEHMRGSMDVTLGSWPSVVRVSESNAAAILDARTPELSLFALWAMRERHGCASQRIVNDVIALVDRAPEPLRETLLQKVVKLLGPRSQLLLCEGAKAPEMFPESAGLRKVRLFIESAGIERARNGIAAGVLRKAVLTVLETRRLPLSAKSRDRIETCDDVLQLEAWFRRALVVGSVAEMFGS